MSTSEAPVIVWQPSIPTDDRSVFPKGKPPTPYIFGMCLVPAMGFGIALSDDRIGFKLFMASLGVSMLILVVALYLWTQALNAGVIRITNGGPLRFVPPAYLRPVFYVAALGFLMPGAVKLVVTLLGLPTMLANTRVLAGAPYAIALITLVALAKLIMSSRVPNGLTVSPEGLNGVRGGARIDIAWSELVSATALGEYGPKLALMTRTKGVVIVDCHYIGSDPAIVVAVLEYYRTHPHERTRLSNGVDAIQAVSDALHKR